jgi:hypothetical protein
MMKTDLRAILGTIQVEDGVTLAELIEGYYSLKYGQDPDMDDGVEDDFSDVTNAALDAMAEGLAARLGATSSQDATAAARWEKLDTLVQRAFVEGEISHDSGIIVGAEAEWQRGNDERGMLVSIRLTDVSGPTVGFAAALDRLPCSGETP